MAAHKVIPESRTCPECDKMFEVGGRGRANRRAVYCSRVCALAVGRRVQPHPGSHAPRPKKNRDTLHNEAWLRARYIDERLSTVEIARSLGCSVPSVIWALRKFSIPIRSNAEAHTGLTSTVEWTSEMREALAVQRRGEANPMHGTVSEHRGPNWHPDPRQRQSRAARASRRGVNGIEYDALVEAQGGLCLTCGRPERKKRADGTMFTLSVDHDHATGKVRGLLCIACNSALGMIADNVPTLRAMIAYLEHHTG